MGLKKGAEERGDDFTFHAPEIKGSELILYSIDYQVA